MNRVKMMKRSLGVYIANMDMNFFIVLSLVEITISS